MNTSLQHITVPADWDTNKDMAFIRENHEYGETFDELLLEVFVRVRQLGDAVDSALAFFDTEKLAGESIAQGVFALENIVRSDPLSESYLSQVLESLFWCRFASEEFELMIRLYSVNSNTRWLMPLRELASHLNAATQFLDETMDCVHRVNE